MYDLKIVNGTIISGRNQPPWPGDLAVRDGRIVALDSSLPGPAVRTLDAGGNIVCPGFIDLHTHCTVGPNANYTRAGVTTVVSGNCGFGRVPCDMAAQVAGQCDAVFIPCRNRMCAVS